MPSGPRRNREVQQGIPPQLRWPDYNLKVIYRPDSAMDQIGLSHTGTQAVEVAGHEGLPMALDYNGDSDQARPNSPPSSHGRDQCNKAEVVDLFPTHAGQRWCEE